MYCFFRFFRTSRATNARKLFMRRKPQEMREKNIKNKNGKEK